MSRVSNSFDQHLSVFFRVALIVSSSFLTLLFFEGSARWLTNHNILSYYKPFVSEVAPETEDWRWSHTFTDVNYVPDAKLFWRPKTNVFPFDENGSVISDDYVCYQPSSSDPTVLVYGDSNTQGNHDTSWPNHLQLLLMSSRVPVQVLNRGVAGYSSHQGLERLKQDLQKYQPKIVVFSFGWNDTAPSISAADPYYKPYPTLGGDLLSQSRAYAVAIFYVNSFLSQSRSNIANQRPEARMPLNLYVQTLKEMYVLAEKHGATPILMTRPHTVPPEYTSDPLNWMGRVPEYNDAVRQLMADDPNHFVDMERYFVDKPEQIRSDHSHFTSRGHRTAAKHLFEYLTKKQLL